MYIDFSSLRMGRTLYYFSCIAILLSQPVIGKSDLLFEKAFGKSKVSQEHQFLVQLYISQKRVDEVLLFSVRGKRFVESQKILAYLESSIYEEAYLKVQAASKNGRLGFSSLKELGFGIDYDESSFILKIEVPGAFFKLRKHVVGKRDQIESDGKEKDPDKISGGVNFSFTQPYSDNISSNGLGAFQSQFESFFNLHDLVIEGDFSFTDRESYPWKFTRKLVSYDFPSDLLRLSFGDLQPQSRGLQGSSSFGGISISRSYQLNPSLRITPSGRQEIFLETPSQVEVYVNGQRREKLNLSSGTHLLSRIPGYSGSNDVEVRITDSFNRVRSLKSEFLYDSSLLSQEAYRYSLNIGFKSESTNTSIEYLSEEPIWTAFYERGVKENLTLQGYGEGDKHLYLSGIRALKSFVPGKVSFDAAVSHINGSDTDSAFSIGFSSYSNRFSFKKKPVNWSASLSKKGRRFTGVSNRDPDNESEWSALFSANLLSSKQSSLSLSSNVDFLRDEKVNPFQLSMNHNYYFQNGVDLNLGFSFERQSDGLYDRRALILVNWAIGGDGTRVSCSYDSEKARKELSLKKGWKRGKQNLDFELAPTHTLDEQSIFTNMNLQSERFVSSFSYQLLDSRESNGVPTSHTAIFALSSALVFSGGQLGLTRPISDSFLIVGKAKSIRENTAYVNPLGDDYLAKSQGILPAIVSDIRDYEHREVLVDVEDLPVGYSISENQWLLRPRHKSGFSIYLDSSSRVLLQGYLIDELGAPISLKAGKIISSDLESEPIGFFTNRKGKFRVLGLREGEYKIELFGAEYNYTLINIPKGQEGIYKAGKIVLRKREKGS